jgi:Protein of unknown function (DUF433)
MGATRRNRPHAQKKLGDPASSAKLAALRARFARIVSQDPEILGGEPVFAGTRVPVKSLFDHLEAGGVPGRISQCEAGTSHRAVGRSATARRFRALNAGAPG